ncbi:MAG: hypothetical protein WC435_03110 [Candidatus Paceibacterota bacterium]
MTESKELFLAVCKKSGKFHLLLGISENSVRDKAAASKCDVVVTSDLRILLNKTDFSLLQNIIYGENGFSNLTFLQKLLSAILNIPELLEKWNPVISSISSKKAGGVPEGYDETPSSLSFSGSFLPDFSIPRSKIT